MSDDDLKPYLPKYGDRLALFAHARHATDTTLGGSNKGFSTEVRKQSLLSRLKNTLDNKFPKAGEKEVRAERSKGNRHAKKVTRRLELGWLHFDIGSKTYKQIKTAGGGGTRHQNLPIDTSVKSVMEESKKLFFPKGVSSKGESCDLTFKMVDFGRADIEETATIGEIYHKTKVKILRLYLASSLTVDLDSEDDDTGCANSNTTSPRTKSCEGLPDLTSDEKDRPTHIGNASSSSSTVSMVIPPTDLEVMDVDLQGATINLDIEPIEQQASNQQREVKSPYMYVPTLNPIDVVEFIDVDNVDGSGTNRNTSLPPISASIEEQVSGLLSFLNPSSSTMAASDTQFIDAVYQDIFSLRYFLALKG